MSDISLYVGSLATIPTRDHDLLTGLADDDHTQYALLAGRTTPQQFAFGTASGASTGYFTSTIHATKGKYFLNAAGDITIDELNKRIGVGVVSPLQSLHASGNVILEPNAGAERYFFLNTDATGTGSFVLQAGGGSGGFGGGLNLFSHAHATLPGWVIAGISLSSGGKFGVNTSGLAGGTNVFTVDTNGLVDMSAVSAGSPTLKITATSDTPTVAFTGGGNAPTTAPAGYLEILVGASARYIPFWA